MIENNKIVYTCFASPLNTEFNFRRQPNNPIFLLHPIGLIICGVPVTTVNSAGSQRASDRVSTEHAGSILAVLPISGYSVWFLGRFRTFFETRGKTKIRARTDSHGTRDSDAPTSPGGGAAGVPLRTPYRHAVLRIAAAFGPRTPHVLRHRVPSASKKELSRPLEAVMDPTCRRVTAPR